MPDYSHFDQVKDLRERMDLVIGVLPHLNDEDLAFEQPNIGRRVFKCRHDNRAISF